MTTMLAHDRDRARRRRSAPRSISSTTTRCSATRSPRCWSSPATKCCQYESAGAFLLSGPPQGPGCILLDLRMPGPNGLELQEALARDADGMPVVFLTGYGDVPTTARAMKRGALDVLTKPVDRETLLAAVRAAHERDAEWRRERERHATIEARFASLTPREQAILSGVVAGRLNKQIAGDLQHRRAHRQDASRAADGQARRGIAADLALIAAERARHATARSD